MMEQVKFVEDSLEAHGLFKQTISLQVYIPGGHMLSLFN